MPLKFGLGDEFEIQPDGSVPALGTGPFIGDGLAPVDLSRKLPGTIDEPLPPLILEQPRGGEGLTEDLVHFEWMPPSGPAVAKVPGPDAFRLAPGAGGPVGGEYMSGQAALPTAYGTVGVGSPLPFAVPTDIGPFEIAPGAGPAPGGEAGTSGWPTLPGTLAGETTVPTGLWPGGGVDLQQVAEPPPGGWPKISEPLFAPLMLGNFVEPAPLFATGEEVGFGDLVAASNIPDGPDGKPLWNPAWPLPLRLDPPLGLLTIPNGAKPRNGVRIVFDPKTGEEGWSWGARVHLKFTGPPACIFAWRLYKKYTFVYYDRAGKAMEYVGDDTQWSSKWREDVHEGEGLGGFHYTVDNDRKTGETAWRDTPAKDAGKKAVDRLRQANPQYAKATDKRLAAALVAMAAEEYRKEAGAPNPPKGWVTLVLQVNFKVYCICLTHEKIVRIWTWAWALQINRISYTVESTVSEPKEIDK